MLRETLAPRGAVAAAEAGAAWCPACAAVSPVLTPEEAAAFRVVVARRFFVGLEGVGVHFVETGAPAPLVCLRSLLSIGARAAGDGVEVRRAAKVLNFRRDGESR